MDHGLLERLVREFGLTPEVAMRLQRMSFEQAVKELETVKVQAKATYRKLAFKYHPDRNPGDAEAEVLFRALAGTLEFIEHLQMKRPTPPPFVVHFHHNTPQGPHFRPPSYSTATTSTSSGTYNAARVVHIRVN